MSKKQKKKKQRLPLILPANWGCREKERQICDWILYTLKSGATVYEAKGAYDGTVRNEIITIVDKQEYKALMDYVKKVDPKAFITVYSVSEISYQPKK